MEEEKSLEELIDKWNGFFNWITAPDCGWSGYDLEMEDFHELKKIVDFANRQRGDMND